MEKEMTVERLIFNFRTDSSGLNDLKKSYWGLEYLEGRAEELSETSAKIWSHFSIHSVVNWHYKFFEKSKRKSSFQGKKEFKALKKTKMGPHTLVKAGDLWTKWLSDNSSVGKFKGATFETPWAKDNTETEE